MPKPLYSTKEPSKKRKIGGPKLFLSTIKGKELPQLKQSETPKANITPSQKKYLDTITGLEFQFKNTLPGSDDWNTYLYENKKYSRTLILHRRKIRIKKRI